MAKLLVIALSIFLSLGLFADMYLPYMKELAIGAIFLYTITLQGSIPILLLKIKTAFPLIIIFLLFLLIGAFTSHYIEGESVFNIKFLMSILFFIFLSAFFEINPKLVQVSLIFFGVGAGLLSLLFSFGILGESAYEVRQDRLILLGENPNSLSVRISLGVLFLIWGAIENGLKLSKFKRVVLLFPIPFMFNVILASGSKGSFMLCIGSIIIYILLLKNISKTIKRGIIVFISFITFFAASLFFQSALYERFLTSDLTTGRSEIWSVALNIFTENPMGVGEAGYKIEINQRIGRIIDTHNLFIYLLVTGGFIAFTVFIYFLYSIFIRNLKFYKTKREIIYLIILFSMLFVMIKTGGVLTYLIMWYFLACIDVQSMKKIL